jgi:hypothetical protein
LKDMLTKKPPVILKTFEFLINIFPTPWKIDNFWNMTVTSKFDLYFDTMSLNMIKIW